MVPADILQDKNLNQNNVLFEELPASPARHQIIKANQKLELVANKIKKKYARQRNRGNLKNKNSRTTKWLKKLDVSKLATNRQLITITTLILPIDIEVVDYSNDTHIHDLDDNIMVDLDGNIKLTNDIDKKNLKETSIAQLATKKIIGKHKKMNKSKLNHYAKLNKMDKEDVIFIKQVHPKNRFKKIANLNDKVEIIKQVPVHPRDEKVK